MKATRLFTTIVTALSLCAVCNLVQGCRKAEKEYRLTHRAHDCLLTLLLFDSLQSQCRARENMRFIAVIQY